MKTFAEQWQAYIDQLPKELPPALAQYYELGAYSGAFILLQALGSDLPDDAKKGYMNDLAREVKTYFLDQGKRRGSVQ